jgi:hypothetical protein
LASLLAGILLILAAVAGASAAHVDASPLRG